MSKSLQGRFRRRLCQSLDFAEHNIGLKLAFNISNENRSQLHASKQLRCFVHTSHEPPIQARSTYKTRARRGFHSEIHTRPLEDINFDHSLLHSLPVSRHEAPRLKAETRPTPSSNDAPAITENSTGLERRRTSLTHDETLLQQRQPELKDLLRTFQHPAQAEWENLWYHGVTSAFRDIAHYFPELSSSHSQRILEQSISEPTLDISGLKKEEQKTFEQDRCLTKSFAPKSESERLRRLSQAEETNNERKKLAALLGLPTFAEYEAKHLSKEQVTEDPSQRSRRQVKREARFAQKKEKKQLWKVQITASESDTQKVFAKTNCHPSVKFASGMTHQSTQAATSNSIPVSGAEHRPLVVGLRKPQSTRSLNTMASSSEAAALNKEIAENVKENTSSAAPTEDNVSAPSSSKPKKEKAPKQPKPQKAAAPTAPTSPALIDLRVGHILRAIAHPNADSLYVSTIAMGDPEGTEHTQIDEETGKVVRTVCSGLNGLVPLEEMQNRKIIVVANLKPVNMRSIKSAAMVLAASPKQPEGADPHAPDRVVELVQPPEGSEAGDKVYFEGWSYGEGKGPEKVLNPKKKQWEAIQPGFYTSEDLVVAFDASQCEEVDGVDKGNLVVEGKGVCVVKTLKGAVVR